MGKIKQFVFGAIAGAGVIFVALQYHVIHTLEGFRVVPRTPQHSVGLAYVDMRNWSGPDFADRPEVTRALVAAGMSDLIVGAATNDLMNSVSSDSPMGQLRGYLNNSSSEPETDPLFDADDFMGIRKELEQSDTLNLEDPFTIPFDRDARKPIASPGIARAPESRTSVAQRAREAMDSAFSNDGSGSMSTGFNEVPSDNFRRSTNTPALVETPSADETQLLEDMLFGNDSPAPARTTPASPQPTSSNFGIFEDVTGALEERADQALERARRGFQSEVTRTIEDSQGAAERFTRNSIKQSLPKSVASMFSEDVGGTLQDTPVTGLPKAIQALQDGFDPFIK